MNAIHEAEIQAKFSAKIRRMNAESEKIVAAMRRRGAEADQSSCRNLPLVISATVALTLTAAAGGALIVKFLCR